ncbi:MAG: hypothetical protein Hals2KO_12860 [Halioglobus sp.]
MNRAEQAKDVGKRASQKADTRKRILVSALNEFSRRGFEGASIRDISASAGVQHGLIKYHFENKEQLWKAAVDFLFERLYEEMAEPDEDRTRPHSERVRRWIHRYVRYSARHPEHARIMVQESMRDSDRLTWAADTYIKEQHKLMTDSLQVTLDLARYPAIETSTLVYMLNAAMQAPFTLAAEIKHVHGTDISSDAFLENYADGVFDLFYRPYLTD